MKRTLIPVLAIILLLVAGACAQETRRYAVVATRNGLELRQEADAASDVITLIPVNGKVKVLGSAGKEITVNGVKGRWTQVDYYDTKGWVFGGNLHPLETVTTAYAALKSGTGIKKDPFPFSDEAGIIPYREKIEVIDPFADRDASIPLGFMKVRWKEITGYVLDSTVSFVPIPDYGINYDPQKEPLYEKNIITFFTETFYRFGKSVGSIKGALGEPVAEKVNKIPNRHENGKTDVITSLTYEGLEMQVMKIPSGDELLIAMDITSMKHTPGTSLLNGPLQKALDKFGIPNADDGDSYSYSTDESGFCGFTIHGKKGVVSRITLNCYPD